MATNLLYRTRTGSVRSLKADTWYKIVNLPKVARLYALWAGEPRLRGSIRSSINLASKYFPSHSIPIRPNVAGLRMQWS